MCLYTAGDDKKGWLAFLADRLFEVFAVVFALTRLLCYGYVVWAAIFESNEYVTIPPAGNVCQVCLLVLLGLQVFWMSLVVKTAMKKVQTGEASDPRSDSDDEGDKGDGPWKDA